MAFYWFEELARSITQFFALMIDLVALFVIVTGAVRAIIPYASQAFRRTSAGGTEQIRLSLGRSLVLALEFLIGADILRTAVAPTWTSIGQLGAIVLLRTLLNYFLEKELQELQQQTSEKMPGPD